MDVSWGQLGRRRKWRTFVNNAQTPAQLLAAWGAFSVSVEVFVFHRSWDLLLLLLFLSLALLPARYAPTHALRRFPLVGGRVIFNAVLDLS